jgi:hypothetical protein
MRQGQAKILERELEALGYTGCCVTFEPIWDCTTGSAIKGDWLATHHRFTTRCKSLGRNFDRARATIRNLPRIDGSQTSAAPVETAGEETTTWQEALKEIVESDPADVFDPDTITINVDYLTSILKRVSR